jgi:phage-related protein|tara:strand:+ start:461 stop:784 length:324 start_codon:yes stop_codon:yes gene_type:complete
MKDIEWKGSSYKDFRKFPSDVIQDLAADLSLLQQGLTPSSFKPFSLGKRTPNVWELRQRDMDGIYRVIYATVEEGVIHILHSFQKKTQQTSEQDKKLARKRYKEIGK